MVQVDENVAGVVVGGVGLHIDVAAFAVANAQEPHDGSAPQLFRRPQPFPGKRSPRQMVNQTDQVQLVGHGGELCANSLQGEKETAVVHDRNSAVGTNRRTINFQRTVRCALTVRLTRGGRSNEKRNQAENCSTILFISECRAIPQVKTTRL